MPHVCVVASELSYVCTVRVTDTCVCCVPQTHNECVCIVNIVSLQRACLPNAVVSRVQYLQWWTRGQILWRHAGARVCCVGIPINKHNRPVPAASKIMEEGATKCRPKCLSSLFLKGIQFVQSSAEETEQCVEQIQNVCAGTA